ncbi:MAG: ECF transporter S component [Eubacteriales bacterium]|jgi:uncharacterized membrane protein
MKNSIVSDNASGRKTGRRFKTNQLVTLGMMTAILLLMAWTPLGYLNIGPLAITFNMIPVAISAIVMGPFGGAVAGAVFGITSFLQCIGVGGVSAMGAALFAINPFLAFIQRFVPRLLDGLFLGLLFPVLRRHMPVGLACTITGFLAAFFNTVMFMGLLVALFGNTEYVQNLMGGHNIIVGICLMVGVNAIVEMLASALITGAVGEALFKAHIVPVAEAKTAAA